MRLRSWQRFHQALTALGAWRQVHDELSRVRRMLLGDSSVIRSSTGELCSRLEAAAECCCRSLVETIKFQQTEGDYIVGFVVMWRTISEKLILQLPDIMHTPSLSGDKGDLEIFYKSTSALEQLLDSKHYRIVMHVKDECTAYLDGGKHGTAYGIAKACNNILKEVIENCTVVNIAVEFLVDSFVSVNIETAETLMEILLPRVRPDSPINAADFVEGSSEYDDKERIIPWAKATVSAAELVAAERWQLDSVLNANQLKTILSKIHRGIMLTLLLSSELKFD